jgi:preprotein translocase subunit SecG
MKRLTILAPAVLVTFLLMAPAALAMDGGQGTYGEANDKVVTNAGFILIAFFPLFIFVMSLLQSTLDKRKARKKAAHRKVDFTGGW